MGILLLILSTTLVTKEYDKRLCTSNRNTVPTNNTPNQTENQNIVYATFSSPKIDFTFEYPDTWIFEENNTEDTTASWRFYSDSKKENSTLYVYSPVTDAIDFCSGNFELTGIEKTPYQLNTFPTNDPETFTTYEKCGGEYGSSYIYWQKGKYFANSRDIADLHKMNIIIADNTDIAQHIAQSIKIK